MSNDKYALKMKALLGLRGYSSIIPINDTQAQWYVTSEYMLEIDVSFTPDLWELKHKEKVHDWVKSPEVPANIRNMIGALVEDYNGALRALLDKEPGEPEAQLCDSTPENPVVNEEVKEAAPDKSKELEEARRKKEQEEKDRLAREENEKKLIMMEQLKQDQEQVEEVKHEKKVNSPSPKNIPSNNASIFDSILEYAGYDIFQLLGYTGAGKSKVALKVAKEARDRGLKVLYIDSEDNLTKKDIEELKGITYHYIPAFDDIYNFVINTRNPLPHYDLVVLDSIGLPVLSKYARMNLNEKGSALLKMQAIGGYFKEWSHKHKALVLVTNQFESDFNKDAKHRLRGFGDKFQYYPKETWEIELKTYSPSLTESTITVFKSRSVGADTHIMDIKITTAGVEVV